jgi:hypothetical protein
MLSAITDAYNESIFIFWFLISWVAHFLIAPDLLPEAEHADHESSLLIGQG